MSKVSLSVREKRVVVAVGCQAERPHTELARHARIPVQQFHRSLTRLIERGVLRKQWIVDPWRIGLERFAVYFSLCPRKVVQKQHILKRLSAASEVVLLQELSGEFEYEMAVLAPSARALSEFLFRLPPDFTEAFLSKSVHTRRAYRLYPRKYHDVAFKPAPGLELGHAGPAGIIDELDDKILRALDENPYWSRREIARHSGVADSTVDLRIRRLIREKILVGATYTTSASLYGAASYKFLLYTRGYNAEFRAKLLTFCEAHPNVTFLIEGFGDWDYEIGVEVENNEQLLQTRTAVSMQFGQGLHSIKVVARFATLKQRGYVSTFELAQTGSHKPRSR